MPTFSYLRRICARSLKILVWITPKNHVLNYSLKKSTNVGAKKKKICRIKKTPLCFITLRRSTPGLDLLACTNGQGLWSKTAIYPARWETAGVALCLCPRTEAPVHLAELRFSQIVYSSECVSLASQMNVLGGISEHFQDAYPCSMCVSGSQDKSVKWVPWDLPASWPNFWFLTPVRLPMSMTAQTVGISNGHLGGTPAVQPLGSPRNGFQNPRPRQKVWFASLLLEHLFLLSDSPVCCVTLLGPSDSTAHGASSVCPRWLVPSTPTSLSQTVWGADATGRSVPQVPPKCPAPRPCPVPIACFSLRCYWKRKEMLRKAIKTKKSSAQKGWAPALVWLHCNCTAMIYALCHWEHVSIQNRESGFKIFGYTLLSPILFHIGDFASQISL